MTITLNVDYRTVWGERLVVVLADGRKIPMQYAGDGRWRATIEQPDDAQGLEYTYNVVRDDGTRRLEQGPAHRIERVNATSCEVYDRWCERPEDGAFYSSAFTECIFRRPRREMPQPPAAGMVTFEVAAPQVRPDEYIVVCGASRALGSWDPAKAPRLSDAEFPLWKGSVVVADDMAECPEYKFVIVKDGGLDTPAPTRRAPWLPEDGLDGGLGSAGWKPAHLDGSRRPEAYGPFQDVAWEEGENRRLPGVPSATGATVVAGLRFRDSRRRWRGAGTAIPVFSLRTETDYGVGEFLDLIPMIDWCAKTGQSFLQVLPINDTTMTHTWLDSYPYNANSTIALHPMYLRLSELGTLDDAALQAEFDARGRELNALAEIDYEQVAALKDQVARALYRQNGEKDTATPEFAAFVEANASWLKPYAAYCVLRDRFGTARWADWGEFAEFTPEKMERVLRGEIDGKEGRLPACAGNTGCDGNAGWKPAHLGDEARYVYYIQYHLDRQLRRVRDYGHSKGVALKGDIPIGISPSSCDAWVDPRLFNMDCQAGAPPDDFSVLGQNWGFPTYNWEEMSRDGYAWWKARFGKMSEYFDAYRIDHLLGFFRIWEIPVDTVDGLLGHFNPALPFSAEELRKSYDFWMEERYLKPYIREEFLEEVFGEYADVARREYMKAEGMEGSVGLRPAHANEEEATRRPEAYGPSQGYRLKPEFDTQRKVVEHFAGKEATDENKALKYGLMRLVEEVLFIEDPKQEGMYHPRISAQHTHIYKSLNDYERWTFDRLYNDFYYIRHNDFWRESALRKLPVLIDATPMLVCGEDLGMIPACVPQVMHELEILSLELERMPKAFGVAFGDTRTYPYLSVCTTSSHDMSGIRQWWEEEHEAAQVYYNQVLHCDGGAPEKAEPWICESILRLNMESPSMLCIVPLQDWLATDGALRRANPAEERINVPKNPRNYWRYRMHLPISALLEAEELNERVRGLARRW